MSNNSNSSASSLASASNNKPNGLGAATYYGAVAVVVFVLIALTIVSRLLYTRRARRLASLESESPELGRPVRDRDLHERLAMERRGEQPGLPTYRESILPTSPDQILAATPMAESPFPRNGSSETLPHRPPADVAAPPKYEDEGGQVQQPGAPPPMRMTNDSVTTLVLPTISVAEAPPRDHDDQPDQVSAPQSTPHSSTTSS